HEALVQLGHLLRRNNFRSVKLRAINLRQLARRRIEIDYGFAVTAHLEELNVLCLLAFERSAFPGPAISRFRPRVPRRLVAMSRRKSHYESIQRSCQVRADAVLPIARQAPLRPPPASRPGPSRCRSPNPAAPARSVRPSRRRSKVARSSR